MKSKFWKKCIMGMVTGALIFASISSNTVNSFAEEMQYSENLIPVMRSNEGVNGVVPFASSEYSDRLAYRAFDGEYIGPYSTNIWNTLSSTGYIGVSFPSPIQVTKMVLISSNSSSNGPYAPTNWTVEASNDGIDWTVLETFTKTNWSANESYPFIFVNEKKFNKYRLNISSSFGTTQACVAELQMYSPHKTENPVVKAQIKITAPEKVNSGETFDIFISAENMKNIYAEDFMFNFQNAAFEFIASQEISEKQDSYHDKKQTDGFRTILASKSEETGIQASEKLFKVTLKALNVEKGQVSITNALIADHLGVETVPIMDVKEILINHIDADVNGDGKYSLGDLAMASFNKLKEKIKWSTVKADVDKSGAIDDFDLKLIVGKIVN